jgi:hypothetical protein
MEIGTFVAFITPFLPFLVNPGSKVIDGVLEELGSDAWNKAKSIWAILWPKLRAKPSAQEAIADLVAAPDNSDLETVFRVQLQKLLDQDPALNELLTALFNEPSVDGTPGTQIVQRVIGNRNQLIGQNYGTAITNIKGNVTIGENQT